MERITQDIIRSGIETEKDGSVVLVSKAEQTPISEEDFSQTLWRKLERNSQNTVLVDVANGEHITAAKLLDMCERVASYLLTVNCEPGDVVAICSPNCHQYVVVFLAAMRIGAVPAGINIDVKTDEIRHQLQLCGANFFVTNVGLLPMVLPACKSISSIKKMILLDGDDEECISYGQMLKADPMFLPKPGQFGLEPHDPALVVFSSGTTGLEKAIFLSHCNLQTQFAISTAKGIRKYQNNQVIFAPFAHLSGCMITLFGLALGYTNHLLKQFDFDVYLELISKNKLETISLIPSIATKLAKSPQVSNYDLSNLKEILCGTASLGKEIEALLMERFPNINIRQAYGLSETCGMCIMVPGQPLDALPQRSKSGSVGIPLPHVKIKIIDEITSKTVGVKEEGELLIKSPLVMIGYGDVKIAAALQVVDDQGWLHTGDLGYYDEDGYIFIVDRIKDIIKYQSSQVSPIELESILTQHPDVYDAGVFAHPDEESGSLPAAWVVRVQGSKITKEELEEYVASNVASHKTLRGGIDLVDWIPRSASGKVVRRKMKKLSRSSQEL